MMILGTLLLGFLASTAYSRISLPKKGLQQDKIIYKHVIGTETCTRCCKIPLDSANPSSTILIQTAPSLRRPNKYAFLSIVLPWLYFLCISMQLTTLPKYVNFLINQGDSSVSPLSARVYGNMQGIDALFTFLSVGYIGRLSDRYGRKPFFLLSSAGLALSYAILLYALHTSSQSPLLFYLSACIDGLTSCMLSQAQAFVTDQSEGDIGVSLSRFQGLAVGMAYTIGIPLSTMLVPWGGMQSPLYASIGVCALNCLLIAWLLPSKLEGSASNNTESQQQGGKRGIWQLGPLGTVDILIRNRRLQVGSLCYLLVTLAHAGMTAIWINYLTIRFSFSSAAAGVTLMIIGLSVALLPPVIIPLLGNRNAIIVALLAHALSLSFVALSRWPLSVYGAMPLLACGVSAMPMLLGHLTKQVLSSEVGTLQGAGETLRTISSAVGSPLFASIFSAAIRASSSSGEGKGGMPAGSALLVSAACSALACLIFSLSN